MHDWTLVSICLHWKLGIVELKMKNSKSEIVTLSARGIARLQVSHIQEWGPSQSINEVVGPVDISSDLKVLRIEMQSGDILEMTAAAFDLPPT